MREIEAEGKTVTMAVEQGLAELGLRRDQVEVQVLQEPNPGFLGIGAKPARVRLREKIWDPTGAHAASPAPSAPAQTPARPPRPQARPGRPKLPQAAPSSSPAEGRGAPAEGRGGRGEGRGGSGGGRSWTPARAGQPSGRGTSGYAGRSGDGRERPSEPAPPPDPEKACPEAKAILEEILKLGGFEGSVSVSWDAAQERVRAEVESPDTACLTAHEGKPLESLQFLATLMLSRRLKTPAAVQVEAGGYWKEKEEGVILQVHQAMEMVKRTSQPVRLQPMDAVMRRLVHRTLANHPEFETVSEGEGIFRKVVLKPRRRSR